MHPSISLSHLSIIIWICLSMAQANEFWTFRGFSLAIVRVDNSFITEIYIAALQCWWSGTRSDPSPSHHLGDHKGVRADHGNQGSERSTTEKTRFCLVALRAKGQWAHPLIVERRVVLIQQKLQRYILVEAQQISKTKAMIRYGILCTIHCWTCSQWSTSNMLPETWQCSL